MFLAKVQELFSLLSYKYYEQILGLMMTDMIKIALAFIKKNWRMLANILTIVAILISLRQISVLKQENSRLESNYYAMCDTAATYMTKSGKLASKTTDMEVTIKELEARYTDAKGEIKDLNVKIKNLESYQRGYVEKTVHDTVTLHDTIIGPGLDRKMGMYSDGCIDLTFTVSNDELEFDLVSKDEIDILISIEKDGKWWQFWKFPRDKRYVTTAVSNCPNTKVSVNTCKIKK